MTFLVLADDRTGALEAAAASADRCGGSIPVGRVPVEERGDPVRVVDLGSRHMSPSGAAARATHAVAVASGRVAHKIDSTLRGNWATELVAVHAATGRPVLVVPAYPDMGRITRGGIVFDHGIPVHHGAAGSDVRGRIDSSEPARHLDRAGATDVTLLPSVASLRSWLERPHGFAVADASSNDDVVAVVERWASSSGIVVAGPSAVVASAVECIVERRPVCARPASQGPVLVVCGSLHPSARTQVEVLRSRGALVVPHDIGEAESRPYHRERTVVLLSPEPSRPVGDEAAHRVAAALAASARSRADQRTFGALVVIGGDTADAVLGDTIVDVGGSVTPGSAWGRALGWPLIVTRAGGFGDPSDLDVLVSATLGR